MIDGATWTWIFYWNTFTVKYYLYLQWSVPKQCQQFMISYACVNVILEIKMRKTIYWDVRFHPYVWQGEGWCHICRHRSGSIPSVPSWMCWASCSLTWLADKGVPNCSVCVTCPTPALSDCTKEEVVVGNAMESIWPNYISGFLGPKLHWQSALFLMKPTEQSV